MHYKISEIKKQFKLESIGETSLTVCGVCGLSDNLTDHLAFIKERKYCEEASKSNIPAFVVTNDSIVSGKTNLIASDPEYVISKIARFF